MLVKKCEYCGKDFEVYPYRVSTAKYCSYDCYHKATRVKPTQRNCEQCGRIFEVSNRHAKTRFCCRKCATDNRRNKPRRATQGKNGYKYVWFSDGSGKPEHIYIMETLIGRKLKKNECVHHIDFNRANNDISNLRVMTRGEHSRLHRKYELDHGKVLFRGNQ